jgi:hypothetical protein
MLIVRGSAMPDPGKTKGDIPDLEIMNFLFLTLAVNLHVVRRLKVDLGRIPIWHGAQRSVPEQRAR